VLQPEEAEVKKYYSPEILHCFDWFFFSSGLKTFMDKMAFLD
jgi:hypothetical protein